MVINSRKNPLQARGGCVVASIEPLAVKNVPSLGKLQLQDGGTMHELQRAIGQWGQQLRVAM